MNVKHIFLIIIALTVFTTHSFCRIPHRYGNNEYFQISNDSLQFKRHKYPHLEASLKVFSTNMLIWGFDRYIVKEDWAYINGQTIKNNFKRGPIWDSNCFSTNMFAHPFHGSIYFNSARTSGLSFGQSIPYVLGGSLMWEFFMESEFPSTNDLLATTFGGVALGEMTFRITDLLVDNRSTGAARVGREIMIGILSPMRAVGRLISGEAWRVTPYRGNVLSDYPFSVSITGGARTLYDAKGDNRFKTGGVWMIETSYGELEKDMSYSPYEWFDFDIELNAAPSSPVISKWESTGILFGKTLEKQKSKMTFGAFQYFRYYDHQSSYMHYRLGEAVSLGGGCIYNRKLSNAVNLECDMHVSAIPLGASSSDFLILDRRDYNWGSGYGVKAGIGLVGRNSFHLNLSSELTHLFSWNGYPEDIDWDNIDPLNYNIQGDKSNTLGLVSSLKGKYYITENLGLSFTYTNLYRRTDYEYEGIRKHSVNDLTLGISYCFRN